MNRLYHMRKPSSRPRVREFKKRDNIKLNIWGAVGWNGVIKLYVNIFIFYFYHFKMSLLILAIIICKLFTNNLTGPGYSHIIENYLAPYINSNYIKCSVIQDNGK